MVVAITDVTVSKDDTRGSAQPYERLDSRLLQYMSIRTPL